MKIPDAPITNAHTDVAVIGAGIAGLVVAWELARAGNAVVVLEEAPVPGGLLQRATDLGTDGGAESFATRTTGVVDLIASAGLAVEVVTPAPGGAHLVTPHGDGVRRVALPRRTVLGMPADALADDVVEILGAHAARRAAAEAEIPWADYARFSLAELVDERYGPAVTAGLVDPLCRSVHSTAASNCTLAQLDAGLWSAANTLGSLTAAVAARASAAQAGSAVAGIRGGMWTVGQAMADAAIAAGAEVRTDARVSAIEGSPGRFLVHSADEIVESRAVVIATGPGAARALLETSPVSGGAVRVTTAMVRSIALDAWPVGSGVIVDPRVRSRVKALTHVNAKWAWVNERLGPHMHVVRASARDAEGPALTDPGELATELSVLMGVEISADDIGAIVTTLWPDAVAAADIDARAALHQAADARQIRITGASVAGTGLASVIPHARALALSLISDLSDSRGNYS